ncbi:MAG: hypothetical protein QGG40_15540 [Myxococcota bacterium]|jgi:hypothetical protein|nr:hypothetical protein [Myxococcota bacterium]
MSGTGAWRVLYAVVLALLVGCGESPECSEEVSCGFGENCVEGVCTGATCATSAQCEMESHCASGSCVSGCQQDDDCYPGDACNAEGTCVTASCRDSHLDCAFKEFCNTATGECYEASGYYCGSCLDDDDCGGNGNMCLGFGFYGDFCGVTCETESDCPSSFTCVNVVDGNGNALGSQCITYCWLYMEGPPAPQASSPVSLPQVRSADLSMGTCPVDAR